MEITYFRDLKYVLKRYIYRVGNLKCYKLLYLKIYVKSKICSDKSFVSQGEHKTILI